MFNNYWFAGSNLLHRCLGSVDNTGYSLWVHIVVGEIFRLCFSAGLWQYEPEPVAHISWGFSLEGKRRIFNHRYPAEIFIFFNKRSWASWNNLQIGSKFAIDFILAWRWQSRWSLYWILTIPCSHFVPSVFVYWDVSYWKLMINNLRMKAG